MSDGVGLGDVGQHLMSEVAQIKERVLRLNKDEPQKIYGDVAQAGAAPAAGVMAFNLGGPPQNALWHVHRISTGGQTPTTAAAGRADVFVVGGSTAPVVVAPVAADRPGRPGSVTGSALLPASMAYWRDQQTALPASTFYGDDVITVKWSESLWVVVSNGTNGQIYVASCAFAQVQDAPYIEVGVV